MKKINFIGLIIITIVIQNASAQEQFSISQYYQTLSILNPAFTGVDDFLDVKIGYRQKWTGLHNSPTTSFVSIISSIGDKTSYNQSPIRTSNPYQIEFIESQKARLKSHGIGGYIIKQEQGAFSEINMMMNYALNIPINSKIRISMGTSIGFSQIMVQAENISVWDKLNDPVYQAYINGDGNYSKFLVTFGGIIYGKKSYAGISYLPVIDLSLTNNEEDLTSDKKIILMSGTKFALGSSLTLIPSILFETSTSHSSKVMGNLLLDIKSIIKTGIGYSNTNDVSISVMFNYKNDYGLGYAFETNLGNESTIGNGTHEVILSLNLFNHLNSSPRLW